MAGESLGPDERGQEAARVGPGARPKMSEKLVIPKGAFQV